MLASYTDLKNTSFPLHNITRAYDGVKLYELYADKVQDLDKYPQYKPVFELDEQLYIGAVIWRNLNSNYPGFNISQEKLYKNLPSLQYTTLPIQIEANDDMLLGLIPFIEGQSLDKLNHSNKLDLDESVLKMLQAAKELHVTGLIHMDLNPGNFIQSTTKEIYLTDLSLARNHFRPIADYFNERARSYCWAPEILNGGHVTEKTAVFSFGRTLDWLLGDKTSENISKLIGYCTEEDQNNRPLFSELE